jgi:hypothetical protein
MRRQRDSILPVLAPDLQISFYYRLQTLGDLYLGGALRVAVGKLGTKEIDGQLAAYVGREALARVASFGLRGEVFFPVPIILEATPFLLGYYRLLYGLSQKEFYSKGPFGRFAILEEEGEIPERVAGEIPALCRSLVQTAQALTQGLDRLSLDQVHDLQLLTLGPSFRGSELNRIGRAALKEIHELIHSIVEPHVKVSTARTILLENASGRDVLVAFADDPDVRIVETLASVEHPCVSMEIKGGGDASNVYNRIGEAEKSHLKAKQAGFFEFWTIVRADFNPDRARRDSPTTSHFFRLDAIVDPTAAEHRLFRDRLCANVGIPTSRSRGRRRKE